MATFKNCEIFYTYYFSYGQGYKTALRGGNYQVWQKLNLANSIYVNITSTNRNFYLVCVYLLILLRPVGFLWGKYFFMLIDLAWLSFMWFSENFEDD